MPTATKLARWMACLGLLCGVLYSVGGLIIDLLTIGLNWGTAMAFGALVGMPLLFGAVGFLGGAIMAFAARGGRAVLDRIRRHDS